MRRLLLPVAVLVVVIAGYALTTRANDEANPTPADTAEPDAELSTPVLSVRRIPEWLRGPSTDRLLESEVRAAVAALPEEGTTSCVAVTRNGRLVMLDGTDGEAVRLIPGELQRIVTVAAFLDQASRTGFTTTVVRDGGAPDEAGVVDGSLYLVGGADPVLSSAAFDPELSAIASTSFEELATRVADALVEEGVTGFTGGVVGDESRHTPALRDYVAAQVWTLDQRNAAGIGPLSALLVDNGFGLDGRRLDPPVDAAQRLQFLLTLGGVTFGGLPGQGIQPVPQQPVAELDSTDVVAIARRAMVDPTTAEMLFKEIGLRGSGVGGPGAAFFAVPLILDEAGMIDLETQPGLAAIDGSGLADGSAVAENTNRLGCDHLVSILEQATGDGLLADVVPPLEDSILSACLPAEAEVRGVVVNRPGITGLAGVTVAGNGDELGFALVVNGDAGDTSDPCAGVLPEMLQAIADHPHGPDITEYAPLPVETATDATDADADADADG